MSDIVESNQMSETNASLVKEPTLPKVKNGPKSVKKDLVLPIKEKSEYDFSTKPAKKKRKSFKSLISFVVLVLVPTILAIVYYVAYASDQYKSEVLFSVRGTTSSPLAALGMASLPGANAQSGDSYVVTEYIKSEQVLNDILKNAGVDLRSKYSLEEIDWWYRTEPDTPITKFVDYWRSVTDAEYNSTTGVITFAVKAFSSADAQEISKEVIKASSALVNTLSEGARNQLIASASEEVVRTEERLKNSRRAVEGFRNQEQMVDVTGTAEVEQNLLASLQKTEAELVSRKVALANSVSGSPLIKSLESQIAAVREQVEIQRGKIGAGTNGSDAKNLSSLSNIYQGLVSDQEFAEKAYIAALGAHETAMTEARKQERYLAIVVEPTAPDYSMYPKRIINIMWVLFGSFLVWLLSFLMIQQIRDHAR